jgi:hypothetical protein
MDPKTHTFTTEELSKWYEYFDQLQEVGPYHDPKYLTLLEQFNQGGETAELFVLDAKEGFVYYPYLHRSLESLPFDGTTNIDLSTHRDIVSSWYYGGPIVSTNGDNIKPKELAELFSIVFDEYCESHGIVSEFIRFDPNAENHAEFRCLDPIFERETVPVELGQSVDDIWDGFEKHSN